jgi:hypothetical protein
MREMRLSGSMSGNRKTESCQTGLRRALRKQCSRMPPGDYRYCACSRLHSESLPPGARDSVLRVFSFG